MTEIIDPVFDEHAFAPDPHSVFGPIVSAFEVEDALANSVRRWIRDYLAEIARQRGMPADWLPEFRSIVTAGDISKFPEDQLPSLMVASPGLDTSGRRGRGVEVHGDGTYVARWRVECNCEVSARGNRQALMNCRLYAAAVRALLIQQALDRRPTTDLELRRVEWLDETYRLRDWTVDRTRAAATTILVIEVADVTNRQMGPADPFYPTDPDEPPDPMLRPDVDRVVVDVTKQPEED